MLHCVEVSRCEKLLLTLMLDRMLMAVQAIMHTLLDYIKKDRLADALVEKLCLRFDAGGEDQSQSRNLAFCLVQVFTLHPSCRMYTRDGVIVACLQPPRSMGSNWQHSVLDVHRRHA